MARFPLASFRSSSPGSVPSCVLLALHLSLLLLLCWLKSFWFDVVLVAPPLAGGWSYWDPQPSQLHASYTLSPCSPSAELVLVASSRALRFTSCRLLRWWLVLRGTSAQPRCCLWQQRAAFADDASEKENGLGENHASAEELDTYVAAWWSRRAKSRASSSRSPSASRMRSAS